MKSPPVMVILIFSLLFLLQLAGLASCQPLSSAVELAALYSLRSSLGLRARDWPRRGDPCSTWTGVHCRSGRVVVLDLSSLQRTRVARRNPRFAVDGLKNLTHLVSFNASGFLLPGPIPVWFGGLRRLTHLDLSSNSISGEIPPALGNLSNLKTLILAHNSLTGPIPPQLGHLSLLVSLDLSFNSLEDSLPTRLFSGASRLRSVALSHNNFSSELPASLWSLLPELELLDVSSNNLTGEFPSRVPGNANANASAGAGGRVFDLSNNLYYGSISSGFGYLFRRFQIVNLSDNYFQGTAPVGGRSTNVSFKLNCFQNASIQRITAECEKFYMHRGIAYDGGVAPNPASSPSVRKSRRRNWRYILAGVLGGLAFVLTLASALVLCLARRGSRRAEQRRDVPAGGVASEGVSEELPSPGVSVKLSAVGDAFTYEQLLRATSEFSPLNLVDHGRSGDLYFGVLEDGASVVVKRIHAQALMREAHVAELDLFAKLSHARLVPFLGHCLEKEDEKLLVYKHMANEDLSAALFRKPGKEEKGLQSLDWIKRLKIATGVAEALCFLHHECTPALVHRDIQASSILLDDKYEVHLGSLSDVCTQQGDGQQKAFTRIWRSSQRISEQGVSGSPSATSAYDVYCFGKVLMELVTGKLGISGCDSAAMNEWLNHTLSYIKFYEKELVTKIKDPTLVVDEDHLEEVWAMAILAKSCLNPKPSKRPIARYILKALENPVKVVRAESLSNSARLRTTSSRSSWHNALFGSWRNSSSDIAASMPGSTGRCQASGGDRSFSNHRTSREIFPEPSGLAEESDEERGRSSDPSNIG
ncbi:probable LRR receptor-like serine/threonine-protein kinase At2g16250 [Phoenix dactylifera]|uniref:Probable LRR receptor-like serine/threonine-protein kinase At2g16250 n=1 Tax=Phoenix dactylifera TaxID=42345 RepID=A0A8B7BY28_PHODC|nr:probable LRR receptor-like serine/threonine-protein kinase At2g16250 [Phoenix dactylifera]